MGDGSAVLGVSVECASQGVQRPSEPPPPPQCAQRFMENKPRPLTEHVSGVPRETGPHRSGVEGPDAVDGTGGTRSSRACPQDPDSKVFQGNQPPALGGDPPCTAPLTLTSGAAASSLTSHRCPVVDNG